MGDYANLCANKFVFIFFFTNDFHVIPELGDFTNANKFAYLSCNICFMIPVGQMMLLFNNNKNGEDRAGYFFSL